MGITVLIVTAVSTSYKREASPVDWEEDLLRFCISSDSTGN